MEVKTIFVWVIFIIMFIMLARYIMKDGNTFSGLSSSQTMQRIEASSLDISGSSNFTYSIWFYIDDWNYRYGESKVIFGRMSTHGNQQPCPIVSLGEVQNNINVEMTVYSDVVLNDASKEGKQQQGSNLGMLDDGFNSTDSTDNADNADNDELNGKATNAIVHTCSVNNAPIQKWCHLFISVYGRTLDIYLDGKLVRTNVLPGVSKIDPNAPLFITPKGGFSGWTAKFQYWGHSSDPQEAWNVYAKGYNGNSLSNLFGGSFGKYGVKFALMEGDTEESSWTV